jgi:hypothetical protein
MALTEADLETLDPWLRTRPGAGAYSVRTPIVAGGYTFWPPFDWERDLDGCW